VALLITDGNANVAIATTAANAAAVRQQYTYVIVLSVGVDPNVYGLWTLASAPTSQTVYTVDSYRDLTSLLDTRFINLFDGMYRACCFVLVCHRPELRGVGELPKLCVKIRPDS